MDFRNRACVFVPALLVAGLIAGCARGKLPPELPANVAEVISVTERPDRTPNAVSLVADFVRKFSIPYQVVLSTPQMEEAFVNVRLMPTSFLVDRDGRVVRTLIGLKSKAEFERAIDPLL
ncbi:MAG TPA: hypothetical protein VJO14_02290 [Bacteroidota bacterium]|nr:hypothetical protein [Bacteroidota bacterium]